MALRECGPRSAARSAEDGRVFRLQLGDHLVGGHRLVALGGERRVPDRIDPVGVRDVERAFNARPRLLEILEHEDIAGVELVGRHVRPHRARALVEGEGRVDLRIDHGRREVFLGLEDVRGDAAVGHITLKVNDLKASIDFYGRLGFPEFLRLTEEDGAAWIVYLRITDELYIELLPGGTGERAGNEAATGLNHLCLTTSDIEATLKQLADAGIPTVSQFDPAHRGVDGNRGAWIADPDGNRIEVMEMAPDCIQHQAIAALRTGHPATSLVRPLRSARTA
ncbi:MAG: VOC family protein [Devosia sp.]